MEIEGIFAGKTVRIYEYGYVQVFGLFGDSNAPFEKLLGISSSYNHKGDDAFLVITTEIETHSIRGDRRVINQRDITSMHKLAAAAKAVLEFPGPRDLSRSGLAEASTNEPTSISFADELAKLVTLRDSGALTDEEFQTLKKKLL